MVKQKDTTAQGRAWARLITANAILLERMEAAMHDAGLPNLACYDVLWTLENAEHGRLRMHDLAQRVVLSRSNLTRLADRLESARLIRREDCPHDRRGNYCALTEAGRKMRQKMWPVYRAQIDNLFSQHLTATEAKAMADCLERVLQAAKQPSRQKSKK
ncbi:MAG: MarR family winged helix-turn-helix transcriptional regulator [Burkholderiales bacterium]